MRLLTTIWIPVFMILLHGCTTAQNGNLVSYEMSGGIAGNAILVEVRNSGQVHVRDRAQTGVFTLEPTEIDELLQLCDSLNETDVGQSLESMHEPECCDLIVEKVVYLDTVYSLDELDTELADSLRVKFEEFLRRGLDDALTPVSLEQAGGTL